jgi:hypothetical protein
MSGYNKIKINYYLQQYIPAYKYPLEPALVQYQPFPLTLFCLKLSLVEPHPPVINL